MLETVVQCVTKMRMKGMETGQGADPKDKDFVYAFYFLLSY